jgi:hypothetical protein
MDSRAMSHKPRVWTAAPAFGLVLAFMMLAGSVDAAAQELSVFVSATGSDVRELRGVSGTGVRFAVFPADRLGLAIGYSQLTNRTRRAETLCPCYGLCPLPSQDCRSEEIETHVNWRAVDLAIFYEPLVFRRWRLRTGVGWTGDRLMGGFDSRESDKRGDYFPWETSLRDGLLDMIADGGILLFAELGRLGIILPGIRASAGVEYRRVNANAWATDTPAFFMPFGQPLHMVAARLALGYNFARR